MTAAAASWGTIGVAKSFLPNGTDPLSVAAARMAIGGGALVAVAARPRQVRVLLGSRATASRLAVAVGAMAGYQFLYFAAIASAGAAIAAVLTMSSIPLFAGLLTRCRGHALGRRWWLGSAGAVTGCALLGVHGLRCGPQVLTGVGCALLAGLLFAVFTHVSAAVIGRAGSSLVTMALVFAGAGLVMSPRLIGPRAHWLSCPSGVLVAAYLGLIVTALAYLLYGHALRTVPVPVVSTLVLTEPAVATVLAVTVLGEVLDGPAGVGLGILCLVLLVTALPVRTSRPGRGR